MRKDMKQLKCTNMGLSLCSYDQVFLEKSYYWLNDVEVQKNMDINYVITHEGQEIWYNNLKKRTDYKIWGLKYCNISIGACGFRNLCGVSGKITMYIGEKEYWGRGFGCGIISLLEQEAKKMGLKYIYAKVLQNNIPSFKSFLKLGYIIENSDLKFYYLKKIL